VFVAMAEDFKMLRSFFGEACSSKELSSKHHNNALIVFLSFQQLPRLMFLEFIGILQ
jgi:hypothetical protein